MVLPVRVLVVTAVGLAVLAAPLGIARAFCRTTTVHQPIPYDPVASGCWTQGTPLAWPAGKSVAYSLSAGASTQVSLADATRVADLAFGTWNTTQCASGQPPSVQAYDDGPVSVEAAADDCGLVQCDPTVHDPLHVIVFDDTMWPHNDPNSTLALTTVTYGVDSGQIYDADMEVNTSQHTITAAEPPPPGAYDLQAILTHEAGHFFGLAHATSTAPIMFAQYQPGAITLTTDDVDGICSMYPPISKSGCACTAMPSGGDAWAFGAGAGLVVLLGARRRRRRRVRPIGCTHPGS
jgi:MYXO-CTERM domain-containing protein